MPWFIEPIIYLVFGLIMFAIGMKAERERAEKAEGADHGTD
jgi:predicted Na+-dependent transporter